jgi:hypothetical protein
VRYLVAVLDDCERHMEDAREVKTLAWPLKCGGPDASSVYHKKPHESVAERVVGRDRA